MQHFLITCPWRHGIREAAGTEQALCSDSRQSDWLGYLNKSVLSWKQKVSGWLLGMWSGGDAPCPSCMLQACLKQMEALGQGASGEWCRCDVTGTEPHPSYGVNLDLFFPLTNYLTAKSDQHQVQSVKAPGQGAGGWDRTVFPTSGTNILSALPRGREMGSSPWEINLRNCLHIGMKN